MTDETRPETTPPTPDGDKPGPAGKSTGKDDSLDSWFRPARVTEQEPEREQGREPEQGDDGESGGGETPETVPEPASESESVRESESGVASGSESGSELAGSGSESAESGSGPRSGSGPESESELWSVPGLGDTAVAPSPDAAPTQVVRLADLGLRSDEVSDAADDGARADRGEVADESARASQAYAADTDDGDRAGQADESDQAGQGYAADEGDRVGQGYSGDEGGRAGQAGQAGRGDQAGRVESKALASDRTQVIPAPPAEPAGGSEGESWSPAPGPAPLYPESQAQPQPRQERRERQEPWQPQPYEPPPLHEPTKPYEPAQFQSARPYESGQRRPARQEPPQYEEYQGKRESTQPYRPPYQSSQTKPYEAPGGVASILPPRGNSSGYNDDFDNYSFADGAEARPRGRARRAVLTVASVFVVIVAVAAALVFSGKVKVFGIGAKPVPTVGFSPSGSDAGSDATQTGTAFLTAWENGNLKAAANITDNQSAALAALTAYKSDLKVSGLTLSPGTASAQGWMTFSVTAQVGTPSSAWSYSSGMATYSSSINGYTRWFVKWQPNVLFTSLKSGQKLALGAIPPVANKVEDKNGTEITPANAPSLSGIVSALKKAAPPAAGTPGQQVQIDNADGSFASKVVKLTDPVTTGAVKTTIDLNVQKAAQSAVSQAPNSSMVVIQPSTGDILAVANNPATGLDTAMLGQYAPGSTFKTITTTLVLNKGVISSLNQTWDCPATLTTDGITLHNSEQESGVGKSFLWDFADSCNNAFSRFGAENKVSRDELAATAHDYFGFDQKWDVGLNSPTIYGHVPDTSSNSLAEELVGQDRIQASPLSMASVAATIANGSFKQPILVPGTQQIPATPIPGSTDQNLKTLMHQVVIDGTLAGVLPVSGMYAKTGTAEVQGKQPNSWTIAFRGDYAVAALAVGGGFGASTAGPEVRSLMAAVQ